MQPFDRTYDYRGVSFTVAPELDIGDIFSGRWNAYVSIIGEPEAELGLGNGDYATPEDALAAGVAYARERIDAMQPQLPPAET
jgi:hypothetical protein